MKVEICLDRSCAVVTYDCRRPTGGVPRLDEIVCAWCGFGTCNSLDLMGALGGLDVLGFLLAKRCGVVKDVKRVFGFFDLGGRLTVPAFCENAAELVRDEVCREAGEDVADRAVEVE